MGNSRTLEIASAKLNLIGTCVPLVREIEVAVGASVSDDRDSPFPSPPFAGNSCDIWRAHLSHSLHSILVLLVLMLAVRLVFLSDVSRSIDDVTWTLTRDRDSSARIAILPRIGVNRLLIVTDRSFPFIENCFYFRGKVFARVFQSRIRFVLNLSNAGSTSTGESARGAGESAPFAR